MKRIGLFIMMLTSCFGQPADSPAFEVASIRLHTFPKGTFGFSAGGPALFRISGTRVTATLTTVRSLLMYAYGVKDYQIMSGDSPRDSPWSDFYDVAATTPGDDAAPEDQVRRMVQGLLAERFQLKLHRETKDLPVYNLIVGKNGPKLKESPADSKSSGAYVQVPGTRKFSNRSISDLVEMLNLSMVDRPVLDKTGLTGGYDFTLEFLQASTRVTFADGVGSNTDPAGASIFTAVQEQLGLKLDPAKAPIEVLVIDHADRGPSAN